MSDKLKVGLVLGGIFSAGALGLAAISANDPKSCSIDADGQIHLNYKNGVTGKAGPAIITTDDNKKCLNYNGGSTPPDWVVPVVAGP